MAAPKGNQYSKGIGRPRKEVDFEEFEKLCGIWCTPEEISAFMKIHLQTLKDRVSNYYKEEFSQVYKRFYDAGKPSFRRDRRVMAKKNAALSIYLGKVHLGETDKAEELQKEMLEMKYLLTCFANELNKTRNPIKHEDVGIDDTASIQI